MKNLYPPVDEKAIEKAVAVLREGGLVAMPTETVYGLAADADNKTAVMKTFAVKGRPTNHPLIVHVADAKALTRWVSSVPREVRLLTDAFWPGPLTLVLPKSDVCGLFVTGGQDSVAVRCPSHPWTNALIRAFAGDTGKGLTAPSANTFGAISPTKAQHVADDLGVKPEGRVDYILDGGECGIGVESTIVNLSGVRPEILRHGAVTRAMLEEVLGFSVPDAGSDAPRASGRLKSHYAPATKLELVSKDKIAEVCAEQSMLRLAVMAPTDVLETLPDCVKHRFVSPETPEEYAHILYARLHVLDELGCDRIIIAEPPTGPEWAAVNDRLGRAAADKTGL